MHIFLHSSMIYRVLGAIVCAVLLSCRFASAQVADEEFEGWHLEPGVGQAHLVMVARVASISQVTIVEGAKTDLALREYRFQPVRRLKGIFSRDQLSMTGADLGLTTEDATSTPLKEGRISIADPGSTSRHPNVWLCSGSAGRHDFRTARAASNRT